MAGIGTLTGGDIRYYLVRTAPTIADDDSPTYAELGAVAVTANELNRRVASLSGGGQSPSVISLPVFGPGGALSGAAGSTQNDGTLTVALDRGNANITALMDADAGLKFWIVESLGVASEDDHTYRLLICTLASVTSVLDPQGFAQVEFGFTLERKPQYADKP